MVFSSAIFLFIFLPLVIIFDRLLPGIKAKNLMLLIASLIFYSFGQPVYLVLLLASTFFNYLCGLMVAGRHRRISVVVVVIGNLAMLGIFKYADFVISTLNQILGLAIPLTGITLPVGISFFTFQGMSYVLDAYRDNKLVSRSFTKVLLYISFFPQLIAGPIVKYHDIDKEIDMRETNAEETAHGICRFIYGLSKKLLISNTVGLVADAVFALDGGELGMLSSWLGAVCYCLQIFFDFAGYSDMAIGMGQMFGFHFLENFDYPYQSTTIKEFWRRWHISLSTWFKEYLYIPLGGNRKGGIRTFFNKLVVFFATGLWHGASWTFVLWGLWHGFFSIIEDSKVFPMKLVKGKALGHIYTLVVVLLGFVLFRADTLAQAGAVIGAMFSFTSLTAGDITILGSITPVFVLTVIVALLLCVPLAKRVRLKSDNLRICGSIGLLILCIFNLASGSFNPFIYFRF